MIPPSSIPPPSPFNPPPAPAPTPAPNPVQPWYAEVWATVAGLVVFAPVGVFLMWKYRTAWGQRPKVVATIVSLLFFLGMLPKSPTEPATRTASTSIGSTATISKENAEMDVANAPTKSSSRTTPPVKKAAPATQKKKARSASAPSAPAQSKKPAPLFEDADTTPEKPKDDLPDNVEVLDIPGFGKRDVGIVDEVVYTVLEVEKTSAINNGFSAVQADGEFYVLTVRAFNNAKKTHNVTTLIMKLLDDQGREFDPSTEGAGALEMSGDRRVQSFSAQVQPGTVKEFVLVYDAPVDASGLRLKIPGSSLSFSEVILRLPK